MGYEVITWNRNGMDWEDISAKQILANITKDFKPGNVILLHDAIYHSPDRSRDATLQAVDMLLTEYPHFRYVTITELLDSAHAVRKPRIHT